MPLKSIDLIFLFFSVLYSVVNNAGIAVFSEIEWCSVDQFQQIMNVNVMGMVRVTKAFLPLLRESKGRVINVASLAGELRNTSSSISKHQRAENLFSYFLFR